MVSIKRIVLDVLKPHRPNTLEFASSIAAASPGSSVRVTVAEVDEKTETVIIVIEGDDIRFDVVEETIGGMGGSLHSIDEVEVLNETSRARPGSRA